MSKIKIRFTAKFLAARKKFVKNNRIRFNDYGKASRLFKSDPSHPSLNLEKLAGTDYWTARLNKADRIFFIWISKTEALFFDVGKHDLYKKL